MSLLEWADLLAAAKDFVEAFRDPALPLPQLQARRLALLDAARQADDRTIRQATADHRLVLATAAGAIDGDRAFLRARIEALVEELRHSVTIYHGPLVSGEKHERDVVDVEPFLDRLAGIFGDNRIPDRVVELAGEGSTPDRVIRLKNDGGAAPLGRRALEDALALLHELLYEENGEWKPGIGGAYIDDPIPGAGRVIHQIRLALEGDRP
jgi:hypothetical protein